MIVSNPNIDLVGIYIVVHGDNISMHLFTTDVISFLLICYIGDGGCYNYGGGGGGGSNILRGNTILMAAGIVC